ncbi:hypothetical protein F5148DRAFT_817004 [Russula earlei]|uniref:Uncharacterized protein n=1 Tax=Russula earlei TaxID=71964 RepID=A0ACC0UCJ7_9AGAM|nr:hypothetical protein F5148DRAFT_817004 [Russula earlei]
MSQSLRAIKRFRLRELLAAPAAASGIRISPPATTAHPTDQSQRPRLAAAPSPSSSSPDGWPVSVSDGHRSGGAGAGAATTTTTTGGLAPPVLALALDNPFVPRKNPKTGRWAPPKYSLRRQAELVEHARVSGTLSLLPPGPKGKSKSKSKSATSSSSDLLLSSSSLATSAKATGKETAATTADPEGAAATAAAAAAAAGPSGAERRAREVGVVAAAVATKSGLVASLRSEGELALAEQERVEGPSATATGEGQGQGQDTTAVGSDAESAWTRPVEWIGTVRSRTVAGADVGNRLYAGKRRMFKGHKWERERERRVARTKMLLRDMDKRVERFRGYRAKGKPLPLAMRTNVLKKTQKLPF